MEDKILLNSSKSKESVLVDNQLMVQLEQNSKILPYNSVFGKIDAYRIYEQERDACTNYRLIFTINNVCSNVLFNMLTEVVKDEGSSTVTILNKTPIPKPPEAINTSSLTRNMAIRNTEYSNEENGFKYFCGADIFNNHLIRSKVFKSVNKPGITSNLEYFNTIEDNLRMADGTIPKIYSYNSVDSLTGSSKDAHLYLYDEIKTFFESYNDELREVDGWVGFNNTSKLKTFDANINKVINNENACTFIDMYPDRSLYSFVPKTNKFRNRLEYNWNYDLTYPFSATTQTQGKSNILVSFISSGREENGILVTNATVATNTNGVKVVFFTCPHKHNLSVGSTIKMFYGDSYSVMNGGLNTLVTVMGIGDLNGSENNDYCFYAGADIFENHGLITTIPPNPDTGDIGGEVIKHKFRLKKIESSLECSYYFRVFRKIPNFRFSGVELTDETATSMVFDERRKFDSTINKLAFSKNIYGDDITQLVFTDDINIKGLVDNLGRPLSEIYLTVVKNNKGWEKWYSNEGNTLSDPNGDIEYSHAFGKITSGLDLPYSSFDLENEGFYNVKYLTNVDSPLIPNKSTELEDDITIDADMFIGDLVEFSPGNAMETVLEKVCHRFNTAQRETTNSQFATLEHDMITCDDYDFTNACGSYGFVTTISLSGTSGSSVNLCPEGYYYNPHIRIPLREFSPTLSQNTKSNLIIAENGVRFISNSEVEITTINGTGLGKNNVIYFTNVIENKETTPIVGTVSAIVNSRTFRVVFEKNISYGANSIFRSENELIPTYATDMRNGSGVFVWREFLKPGVWNATIPEYTYTNNAKYIHQNVNFYLKRQDPHDLSGLRAKPISDTMGNNVFPVLGNKIDITPFEYYIEDDKSIC